MKHLLTSSALALFVALAGCQETSRSNPETSIDARAETILAAMTLEEKIGQIIQADIAAVTPAEVKEYNLGSVLNGGNSAPGGGKVAPPEDWIALADEFWTASTDTSDGGVGIPAIWGTDAVHGHNNLQSATIFPHNIGLGAANDVVLMKEIGRITAKEIRATGIDWTFAPTLAVARDDRWGRAYESYSENPQIVANYAKAMVEGLQGEKNDASFLVGDHVMATAKHFVGDGGTQNGIDKGDTLGSEADLIKLHGAGYPPAIEAGVQSVMASFSSINGEKMHGSKHLLTDVLRGDMGFEGFVVGDWNGHAEVPGCTATDCPQALEAGIDMYMAPDSWRGLYNSLLEQAESGEIEIDTLDRAILRILRVKIRSGLFEAGKPSSRKASNPNVLGQSDHSNIAQEAVRKSLVLLKNNDSILPLNPSQNILVTGSGADSMQQQTGGWTLNWQGDGNANDIFHTGETIYDGLKAAMESGNTTLSVNGSYKKKPDVAVVVFGEQPYAEYRGDKSDVIFEFSDGENLKLLRKLKAAGIPVVSIFLSGRPMWMNEHINASDAFVAAWLPGTEGEGVADVLVTDTNGNFRHDFTGRLSFSWPSNGTGEPINDSSDPNVQWPLGYGLSYASKENMLALHEKPGLKSAADSFTGEIIKRGDAAKPFSFYLGDSSNLKTPASELVSHSLGGIVSTRGVDYKAQEDAREITWNGKGLGSASIQTRRPIDLAALGKVENLAVSITWRIDERPSGPFTVSMGCGEGCSGTYDLNNKINSIEEGSWTTTSIPLACFIDAGLKPTSINTTLKFDSPAKGKITLHGSKITKSDQAKNCS